MVILALLDGEVRDVSRIWNVATLCADYERGDAQLRADFRFFFFVATPWGVMPLR